MNSKSLRHSLQNVAKALGYDIEVHTNRSMVDTTVMFGKKEYMVVEEPCTIRVVDTLTKQEYEWAAATAELDQSVEECLRALVTGDLG